MIERVFQGCDGNQNAASKAFGVMVHGVIVCSLFGWLPRGVWFYKLKAHDRSRIRSHCIKINRVTNVSLYRLGVQKRHKMGF